jgi:hypothetical protein
VACNVVLVGMEPATMEGTLSAAARKAAHTLISFLERDALAAIPRLR